MEYLGNYYLSVLILNLLMIMILY